MPFGPRAIAYPPQLCPALGASDVAVNDCDMLLHWPRTTFTGLAAYDCAFCGPSQKL